MYNEAKGNLLRNQGGSPTGRGSAGEGGFSIIEMMIAVVVIVFGLASVVGVSVYISKANATSNTLNVLAAAAQDQVDRLRTAVWTTKTENPMITVGGTIPSAPSSPTPLAQADVSGEGLPPAQGAPLAAAQSSTYTYTLDANDPHRAAVTNTPVGDLRINWRVIQGPTPEVRYITVKVEQVNAPPHLSAGFTVSTILTRN